MNKKIIGVFCGSFNPPHLYHLLAAEQLVNNRLDHVLFVPVNAKYQKKGLIENKHRYNMLKLICDKNENFDVSDIEIKADKWMRTFETLTELQARYPNDELRLIIGTDNLKGLYDWYEIESLLSRFKVIVLSRDEDNIDEIIEQDPFLSCYKDSFIQASIPIRINLSSTYVRDLIAQGREIKYMIPDEAIDYIKKNHLYARSTPRNALDER